MIDTGPTTNTGGRVKRLQPWLRDGTFMLTYGDGVCDVDLGALPAFHRAHWRNLYSAVTGCECHQSFLPGPERWIRSRSIAPRRENPRMSRGSRCGWDRLQSRRGIPHLVIARNVVRHIGWESPSYEALTATSRLLLATRAAWGVFSRFCLPLYIDAVERLAQKARATINAFLDRHILWRFRSK